MINQLYKSSFDLTFEDSLSKHLIIQYTNINKNEILITQEGLIRKITTTMNDINKSGTLTTKEAPGSNRDREPIEVPCNYRPITGMILYLSTNTRPDIMYAASQVTRYSHSLKTLHRTEVTRIVRCLSGSKDQGVTYNQSKTLCVDYFVDTNLQDHIEINHLRALQVQMIALDTLYPQEDVTSCANNILR